MLVKDICDIGLGFTQEFKYTPLAFGSFSSNRILELVKTGAIDKDDVKVCQYLYKFKCAPLEYILRDIPDLDPRKVSRNMQSLIRNRILNAFVLTNSKDKYNDVDGLVFYTLDYGAILLLRCLIDDENLENWKATDLFMTGGKVRKALMCIDFYSQLKEVEFYEPNVVYASFGAKIKTGAVFKQDGKVFLTEFVNKTDLLESSETKIVEKILRYNQLLETDGWTYYFEKKPILLIVCDCKETKTTMKNRLQKPKKTEEKTPQDYEIQYAILKTDDLGY